MKNLLWRSLAVLILLSLFGAAPARAEWRRADSPNFILHGNASESQLRERILLLEDFDRLLRVVTSIDTPPTGNKLHIYLLRNHDELLIVNPVPPGIAGYYMATSEGIAAFLESGAQGGGNELLFHEYAHHFMRQNTRNAYPVWYVEGFAEYYATVRFAARHIDIGNYSGGRVYPIVQGNWLPMERILSGGTAGLDREGLALYYAQAWLLVHYFYSTPERQAVLGRLLPALRSAPPAQALQAATGLTPETLTQELRRYIRGGQISYRRMPRAGADAAPAVTVTALPRSAADMIVFEGALRVGIREENRQPYLQRIRAAAARYPDDPLAMRVQAHAELLFGDGAVAERLLDRLLAATPGNAELLYLKGMRYLIAAEGDDPPEGAATARIWFARAHRADGNHFQTLYRYAQSLRGERAFISDNTKNMMLLAHQLAPQVADIAMNTAGLMVSRREYAEAIALLRPLAQDPHNTGLARAARQMIERAEARQRPAGQPEPAATPNDPPAGNDPAG